MIRRYFGVLLQVAMREALGKRLLSEGMSPESFQTTTADHSFEDWAKKLAPLTNTQPKTYYLAGIYENNKFVILKNFCFCVGECKARSRIGIGVNEVSITLVHHWGRNSPSR